ncbi:hypothetical protein [Elioraea rosea]|uniref:hypothetical protein n=1 Tax=Elioraea rosea TaxID=2492390 RepID=UPI001182D1EE|nr:hypothetical protein [Elioraea rosea]
MRRMIAVLTLLLSIPAIADAQSPYAGMVDRPIRALSDEQQADLLAGRGMGLALAAELNGWPGPLHGLELADRLALTDAQRDSTERLAAAMRERASTIGARIVEEERVLDALFRERRITEAELDRRTAIIGMLQGELRNAHLRTHVEQAALLTQAQMEAYDHLRGYRGTPAAGPHRRHRRH